MPFRMIALGASLLFATNALAFDANSPAPVNLEPSGVTLKGYDPVAYFKAGEPTPGSADITAEFGGATYQFSTAANRDLFVADPEAYAPAFGGFCAFAMSKGYKFDIDPTAWKIVDDQLYVQANSRALELWSGDISGNIVLGEENWPQLKDKTPNEIRNQ